MKSTHGHAQVSASGVRVQKQREPVGGRDPTYPALQKRACLTSLTFHHLCFSCNGMCYIHLRKANTL